MSTLSEIAGLLWTKVIGTNQAVPVITAVISGVKKKATGEAPSVIASIAQDHPEVLQVIEAIAEQAGTFIGGPLGGWGAKEIVELLAEGHSMTPDEEKLWMDRQTSEH